MAHDLVTELLQYSSLACFMLIWQLCANLLIPNCLRSNLSYSPLAALELYVIDDNVLFYSSNHTVGYIICYILVLIPEFIAFVGVIKGAINNIIKKCLNPFK